MKCNVGTTDRFIRLIAGLGLAIAGVIFESYWGLIGVVLMATALFKFCPIYRVFNISTSKEVE
jgi:Flp pilus assembly protein TadB